MNAFGASIVLWQYYFNALFFFHKQPSFYEIFKMYFKNIKNHIFCVNQIVYLYSLLHFTDAAVCIFRYRIKHFGAVEFICLKFEELRAICSSVNEMSAAATFYYGKIQHSAFSFHKIYYLTYFSSEFIILRIVLV